MTVFPTQHEAWLASAAECLGPRGNPLVPSLGMSVADTGLTVMRRGRGPSRLVPIGAAETGEPSDLPWTGAVDVGRRAAQLLGQPLAIEFPRVPADSQSLAVLKAAFVGCGFMIVRDAPGTPTIALDASWTDPESKFNAGRRSDFRRARRHAETAGDLSFEMHDRLSDVELDRYLEEAYAVEARSWKGEGGTALAGDATLGPFFRHYAHAALKAGILRLAFMRIGGVAVGMQLAVEHEERLWLLKIGYDPAHARSSPGNLLMLYTLGEAARRGLRSYEFLGSVAPWTTYWTSSLRPYLHVRFYPRSVPGLLALAQDRIISAKARLRERSSVSTSTSASSSPESGTSKARLGRPVRRLLRAAGTRVLGFASRAYVPGPHLDDAMSWVTRMERQGIACTLGYFNGDDEAHATVAAQDMAAIEALSQQAAPARGGGLEAADTSRRGYVSLKVPSLGYDHTLLSEMAAAAARAGQIIHFDSHGPETATPTIDALKALVAPGRQASLTIPSRWARSAADADWAVRNDVRVRLVKGQWACPEQPDVDLRESYLRMIDHLAALGAEAVLAGRAPASVAVATHDAGLVRESLARLMKAGCVCELELLCGLPRREAIAVARDAGVPVRLYIPFGRAWLPYALDQAVRSPKMMWWMLRDTISALR